MVSPTYSGIVALHERTLYPFICFTWSTMMDNVYCSAKIKIALKHVLQLKLLEIEKIRH